MVNQLEPRPLVGFQFKWLLLVVTIHQIFRLSHWWDAGSNGFTSQIKDFISSKAFPMDKPGENFSLGFNGFEKKLNLNGWIIEYR